MFKSFFPNPRAYFISMLIFSLICILSWYGYFIKNGSFFGLGWIFGFSFENKTEIKTAQLIWHYQYILICLFSFSFFWLKKSPHIWAKWSVIGTMAIFFINYFMVQLDVMINEWFGEFYNLIQLALSKKGDVQASQYYWQIATFLKIALLYVSIAVIFKFFINHYVFRWRTALNEYYTNNWPKLRKTEGASQRIQEDTMRFAKIMEELGTNLLDSMMTLIAFLPILWTLSKQVKSLPIIGEIEQGLLIVLVIWSIFGTLIVAMSGIKLPGLEFNNQKVEAAFRKELVHGEDDENRAKKFNLENLFLAIKKNYFRLYFHYFYFNIVRILYLQVGNLVPYIALGPSIISGAITLGVMQQIIRAFGRVEGSFQYLVNSWSTIVEMLSIYKRLKLFEEVLKKE
ncbi:peptide antibiotic transporter SbmA [Flavobacteriaceae bacterium]|nr:peptide antibiotic transporter SbmA [Flavobacteriaceae bacterium]